MRLNRPTLSAFAAAGILFFSIAAFAQTPSPTPDADKKKKEEDEKVVALLDKAIADVNSLRLPQNRAIVYGMSGDLYWKFDQNRSRQLFRDAANELVLFVQQNDKETEDNDVFRIFMVNSPQQRTEVLSMIAKRDAELALELLLLTRSARLTEAIAKYAPRKVTASPAFDPSTQSVVAEINLEQRFALLAADENPELAIRLIKESLAKGFSTNVLPLLEKIHKKDEKKAADLAAEIVKKIVEIDLMKSIDDLGAISGILTASMKSGSSTDKKWVFSEAQLKEITTKIANAFLQPDSSFTMMSMLSSLLPAIEKYAPDKAALLKQKQTQEVNALPADLKLMQQRSKIWGPMTTAADLIAELPKLSEFDKYSVYSMLQVKITEIDDEARAKKLIDQIPDEKMRVTVREAFDASQIVAKAKAGKLDDARKMIGGLTKRKAKIQSLVKLALDFHKTGKEKDAEIASALMSEARGLMPEVIETNEDLNDTMEVVRGFATIERDTAFRLSESVIDQINEHVQASSVLARFNPEYASFKKGEMIMRISGDQWESPLFRFIPQMQALGKADLDRMNMLTDRFNRSDARTVARLYVLQGVLQEEKKPAAAPASVTR